MLYASLSWYCEAHLHCCKIKYRSSLHNSFETQNCRQGVVVNCRCFKRALDASVVSGAQLKRELTTMCAHLDTRKGSGRRDCLDVRLCRLANVVVLRAHGAPVRFFHEPVSISTACRPSASSVVLMCAAAFPGPSTVSVWGLKGSVGEPSTLEVSGCVAIVMEEIQFAVSSAM